MNISAGRFLVELTQVPEKGTPWEVCVYKKVLWFNKRISSDWFLDGDQAKTYAEQLAKELQLNGSVKLLTQRPPGWILHRPIH